MRPKIWILYLILPGRFGLLFTGLLGGVLHLVIIDGGRGTNLAQWLSHALESSGDLGALIVWVVMTITIVCLVQNGIRIGRLARRLRPINLFRTDRLLPFARVAVSSSLAP